LGALSKARSAPLARTTLPPSQLKLRSSACRKLDTKEIEDVILGCAMPEGEQGMNVARIAALRAGLPVEVSAMTINRFCSSGLQAIAMAAERIQAGGADVIVAGGTESMSMIPMGGNKISPNPWLVDHYPGLLSLYGIDC
jgi:acetyl-CoA acyltransferase